MSVPCSKGVLSHRSSCRQPTCDVPVTKYPSWWALHASAQTVQEGPAMIAVRSYASLLLMSVVVLIAACSIDGPIADQAPQSRSVGTEERGIKVNGVRTINL